MDFGIPPYEFTLSAPHWESDTGFALSKYKWRRVWFDIKSPQMRTHLGGCKFYLKLCPSEFWNSDGTHMTVKVYSVDFDYDYNFKFPFRFTITLELLNQHRDQDHYTKDIKCEVTRKTSWDSLISSDLSFIPNSDLEWNEDRQTQYLKNNCLKFRVPKIVLS